MKTKKFAVSAIAALMVFVMAFSSFAWAEAEPKSGTQVEAVFFGDDLQLFIEADGDEEMLDTFWVYYSDGTFEQFAEVEDKFVLFSVGTYEFGENNDFHFEAGTPDKGIITIRRNKKYNAADGLADYESEHTYELGTLGYDRVFVRDENGKNIKSIFYGNDKQPYVEEDGDDEMLDTALFFYSDGTFDQYIEKDDQLKLYGQGTYEMPDAEDFGKVTISVIQKDSVEPASPETHDLKALGFDQMVAIAD